MNACQLSDLLTSLVRGEQGSHQEGGNGNNTGGKAISQVKEAQDDDYIITYTEVFYLGHGYIGDAWGYAMNRKKY